MSKYMDQSVANFLHNIKRGSKPVGVFATILARSENKRPPKERASRKKRGR